MFRKEYLQYQKFIRTKNRFTNPATVDFIHEIHEEFDACNREISQNPDRFRRHRLTEGAFFNNLPDDYDVLNGSVREIVRIIREIQANHPRSGGVYALFQMVMAYLMEHHAVGLEGFDGSPFERDCFLFLAEKRDFARAFIEVVESGVPVRRVRLTTLKKAPASREFTHVIFFDMEDELCQNLLLESIATVSKKQYYRSEEAPFYEKLDEYIRRMKDYHWKLHTCGRRNSFAKTDTDATFMRMKEDAMKNGQLKPAYNIQYGSEAQFIVWADVFPKPTDTTTLIPFLEGMHQHLGRRYPNIVADAGYESEENYAYLKAHKQTAYIKPNNYEASKTRKWKHDIGCRENMQYLPDEDAYLCSEGRKLVVSGIRHAKSRTGFVSEKTCYTCKSCKDCPRKADCIHGNHSKQPLDERTKHFEVAKVFQQERQEDLARITNEHGIELRVNRSIQAEGAFADVKADRNYRRFLTKGHVNVEAETILLAMAHNIFKLHCKIQAQRLGVHLIQVAVAA